MLPEFASLLALQYELTAEWKTVAAPIWHRRNDVGDDDLLRDGCGRRLLTAGQCKRRRKRDASICDLHVGLTDRVGDGAKHLREHQTLASQ